MERIELNSMIGDLSAVLSQWEKLKELENVAQYYSIDSLPRVIKAARKRDGLTQQDLADMIGVSTGTLKAIESGKGNCTFANIQAVAAALGVKLWCS